MRLYLQLTKLAIHRQVAYRAATLAGLATNFFFGLLRAAVLVALFGARQQVEGIDIQGAITYTGISQAAIGYLALFSWYDLMNTIYTGQVGADLLKPVNYFGLWLAQDLGRALVNLLMRGLPIMLFYALVFDIAAPNNPLQWSACACAAALAWLVSFSWRFLVNLAAFWTPNAFGVSRIFFALSWFTSGFLMPLRFFPEWFQRLCYLTPFPHTINTVIEIYLGLHSGADLFQALLMQVIWILALFIAGQIVLRAGMRRLVIQGG
ncbi:MAG: ABC-2 family transporter protein [Anaerolineales bacterium]|nr:ABC-2 family transporter protein [Anaerolineales bacterium]